MRLHRDPGAEGGPRPDQAREPPALEPARDAEGTQEEEEAEKKIALAGLPGAAGQMVRREDERAAAGGERAPRRRQRGDHAGGGHQPREVEDAPGEVAAAERAEHGEVHEVRPGLVHVEEVAVRHRAVGDPPRGVVHERDVVDQRPRQRAPREQRGERPEAGQEERASDRSRPQ